MLPLFRHSSIGMMQQCALGGSMNNEAAVFVWILGYLQLPFASVAGCRFKNGYHIKHSFFAIFFARSFAILTCTAEKA